MGKIRDLFRKTRNIKGTFCTKIGTIKDRNSLNEQDYHDDVVRHPEPDIPESKVKWTLGSTAVNKASGCDGIPVELFKILKDNAIKVLHSICQ